jgi:hypothetical protein
MAKHRGFNTYGFHDQTTGDHPENYLHCPIHIGNQLVKVDDIFVCPSCGLEGYQETELTHETSPTSKFGNNKGKMILQKNTKKHKLRAEDGSEIPADDTQIIQDLSQGLRVLSYNEWKPIPDKKH